jgi:hypothetical protein
MLRSTIRPRLPIIIMKRTRPTRARCGSSPPAGLVSRARLRRGPAPSCPRLS